MKIRSNVKLLLASFSFLLTCSILATSAFAWFEIANFLQVSTFSITIGDADPIQLGLVVPEGIDEKYGEAGSIYYAEEGSFNSDLLKDFNIYDKEKDYYTPVSSMYQSKWLNESTDLTDATLVPQLRTAYSGGGITGIASSGFLQFEVYLRSTYLDLDVYFGDESTLVADEKINAKTAADYGVKLEDLNNISKYMRVSYLTSRGFHIWEPNVDVANTTLFAGKLDVLPVDGYYDYDLNNKEILYGEYDNSSAIIYLDESQTDSQGSESSNAFLAKTKAGVSGVDLQASLDNHLNPVYETSETSKELCEQNEDTKLLELRNGQEQRMVITVYAEGWDLDSTDETRLSSFSLNLNFVGQDVTDYTKL